MPRRIFWKISWRYLLRHPWQSALMGVGIMLGVAVMVAIDLANASASRAFDLSTEAVAGRATHQITSGPGGLDEAVYTRLRRAGLGLPLAPVMSEYVYAPQLGDQPLQLLGLDPFAEAPFRSYLTSGAASGGLGGSPSAVAGRQTIDLSAFLTRPGAVLISQGLAERYGLAAGQTITLELSAGSRPAWIAGLIQPQDELARRGLEGLILADIATVQELTGREGVIDRVDVILDEPLAPRPPLPSGERGSGSAAAFSPSPQPGEGGQAALLPPSPLRGEGGQGGEGRLRALLPPSARLEPVAARSGAVAQMTAAFRVNLTALSLLALVVGMFLIYNTITFSVVQRRPLFGTLRCLGATRSEVFGLVLSEAWIVGLLGSGLGLVLGVLLGQGAVRLVTQTINDLFFTVSVRGVQIPLASLGKGLAIGLAATLATAAPPAWEAASVPPRLALSRSGLESKAHRAMKAAAWAGLGLILAGGGLLRLPARGVGLGGLFIDGLTLSFAATFVIVVGCALLAPVAVGFVAGRVARRGGTLWRMAARGVAASLSRTAIAVMALMVAVSVTIGVALMVGSFRNTVVVWLGETLQGDVYISVPGVAATTPRSPLKPAVLAALRAQPGVSDLYVLRAVDVDSPLGPVELAATDNAHLGQERTFLALDAPVEQVWPRLLAGAVLVSEPFANRAGLPLHGGQVTLYTAFGPRTFPVLGVYYDYGSTQGTVLMALPVYRSAWQDETLTAAALRLAPGQDVDATVVALQDRLRPVQRLAVVANAALRREVLKVFDRTFAITGALQLLATLVAFIGVLSALLSLELERQRELGILRAVGMTGGQLWRLILMETGLMGVVAGLLSMPTGYLLSLILVYIINRRSFGWTLQMQLVPQPFLQALAVAVVAALLAGLYPAWRMTRMITSEAIRSE